MRPFVGGHQRDSLVCALWASLVSRLYRLLRSPLGEIKHPEGTRGRR
jgi:hypothetical protein